METISQRLDLARRELLDLSLKNPLINYRLRMSSGVEFPFLNAADVFNSLVNENKKAYFTTEKSNNPSRLYTALDDKQLHQKLVKTYRASRMYIEEKGANILFLALGFLKWRAGEDDEVFYRAPLLLVPVEFCKTENLDRFYLQYSGDEVRLNISLITKLQTEYGIGIDYEYEGEIAGINEYFRNVDKVISVSSRSGWQVESSCGAFDFFSFAKFLMYKDLDLNAWQGGGKSENPMLKKLFLTGFSDRLSSLEQPEDIFSPYRLCNVVDADSSQANVIWQIANGRNMVIQGPPGTGKSQTITNIIASCVANGKTVLFVAEKKAALDVVKARLERVGLGDLVLELHSYKSNKSDVLKSIEHTVSLGAPNAQEDLQLRDKYDESKSEIEEHRRIAGSLISKSQATLSEICGNLLKIREKADGEGFRMPRMDFGSDLAEWTKKDFEERIVQVQEYMSVLKLIGKPDKHPFYGVRLKRCMPYEQVIIKERICDLEDSLLAFLSVVEDIGSAFSCKSVNTLFESGRLVNSIDALERFKGLGRISSKDILSLADSKPYEELVRLGREIAAFRKNLPFYRIDPYADCEAFIGLYEDYTKRHDSEESGKKEQRERLTAFLADGKYSREALSKLYGYEVSIKVIKDSESLLRHLFPNDYNGVFDTDWLAVKRLLAPAREFAALIAGFGILPQTKGLVGDEDLLERLIELRAEYEQKRNDLEAKVKDFLDTTQFDSILRFGSLQWHLDMSFGEFKRLVGVWKEKSESVIEIVRYNEITDKFMQIGLGPLLEYSRSTSRTDNLDDILANEYYEALINFAYSKFEHLRQFKEYRFERLLDSYRSLDVKLMVENIKRVLKAHYDSMPRLFDDTKEMGIIRREIQKKKNQLPIRKLFSKTIGTVKRIKPVFMMSPISIASFMPSQSGQFDLVIFDEASQVRPVEAFGALLRSKQIVVVGDSKQLPPTTFFDTLASKYDEVNDEDYDFANMESILSLLLARNIPERTLSWHYRSRNQSLIAVSNNEFYGQSLKVFPSVYDKDSGQGLIYRHVPDAVYDRGVTRTNKREAAEVIKTVFEHAQSHPDMSIGVVSFSLAQQEELYREFDRQRRKKVGPEFDKFFDSTAPEPFFIKNLESVQGDERDVIFISIGYGYDSDHKVSMDFGPLNKEGGERRLNVLITRAKFKCFVFSNLTCHDINLSKTSAAGVVALKRFLEYAQNRTIIMSKDEAASNGAFGDYISDKLSEYGYDVDRGIGVKIGLDLAVFDKDLDRFTVGIECDEAQGFEDMTSVTDRERIRPNVLESLGWKTYRLWPASFHMNPRLELSRLLDFISDAAKQTREETQKQTEVLISRKKGSVLEQMSAFVPYKAYSGPKRRAQILSSPHELAELIASIVQAESPIHLAVLKRTLLNLTNLVRLTPEQSQSMMSVIEADPDVRLKGDFVYDAGQQRFEVRNRSEADKHLRRAEYVADEEYEAYVCKALFTGDAASKDDLYRCVSDYLGVSRSKRSHEAIDRALASMAEAGKISFEKGSVFLVDDAKDK